MPKMLTVELCKNLPEANGGVLVVAIIDLI